IHAQLHEGRDGRVYGATHTHVEDANSTRKYPGGHWFAYDPKTDATEDLGWARRHEGIITCCMDRRRNVLYGISWPTGYLFACRPDEKLYEKRLRILGLASSQLDCSARYVECVKDGRVYVPDGATGRIRVFDPTTGRLRQVRALRTPVSPEAAAAARGATRLRPTRHWRNWWISGTRSPDGMHIFLTSQRGNRLVEIDATRGEWGAVEKQFTPKIYPGRLRWGEVHIYDSRGKAIVADAVPGMGHLNGIGIDTDDNLYMLAASKRLIDGKKYDPDLPRDTSGTLVKVKAGEVRVLSAGGGDRVPLELPPSQRPKRPPEIQGRPTGWIEGAEWFYGGVGFCTPGGCICVNSRFDLDYFNRSFAPEPLAYRVAVLDSAGNLITRVGRYGSVDDGRPLVVVDGGPAEPNTVGGDEVALFHPLYVAAHTDRRLFIADQGNARVLSVRLGYHATERVALRDVAGD
ncbi:MAG: hypothetical protein ACOC8E_05850, partial [Planctomycetota bacterium]